MINVLNSPGGCSLAQRKVFFIEDQRVLLDVIELPRSAAFAPFCGASVQVFLYLTASVDGIDSNTCVCCFLLFLLHDKIMILLSLLTRLVPENWRQSERRIFLI